MDGYVKSYRKTLLSKVWQRPDYWRVFEYLVWEAHHDKKPYMKCGIEIKRGQTLKSLTKIQEGTMYQENNKIKLIDTSRIRKILIWLEQEQMISRIGTGLATLITIVNYDLYQPLDTGLDTSWTQAGHNNKNERMKEINKENISIGKNFKKPSVKEIGDYCSERKNNINPQAFWDFYESKGWLVGKSSMKDWKAAVRTWENKRKEENKKDDNTWNTMG